MTAYRESWKDEWRSTESGGGTGDGSPEEAEGRVKVDRDSVLRGNHRIPWSTSTCMAGMGSFGPPSPVSSVIPGSEQRCRGGNGGRPPLTMKKRPRGPGAAAPGRGSGAAPPRPKHPAYPHSSEDFRCRLACAGREMRLASTPSLELQL